MLTFLVTATQNRQKSVFWGFSGPNLVHFSPKGALKGGGSGAVVGVWGMGHSTPVLEKGARQQSTSPPTTPARRTRTPVQRRWQPSATRPASPAPAHGVPPPEPAGPCGGLVGGEPLRQPFGCVCPGGQPFPRPPSRPGVPGWGAMRGAAGGGLR